MQGQGMEERMQQTQRGERNPINPEADGALVRRPIDPQRLLAAVASPEAGANVLFVGTARGFTNGVETTGLEYEAHDSMATEALERLCTAAVDRFSLLACAVEHRLGRVAIGEAAVGIAASAPHRRAAFEAAEWLMERIKREVPIWKCEEWADGRRAWVHAEPAAAARGGDAGYERGDGPVDAGRRRSRGRGRRR
jgi:molybdopterin synthase catalytic subunit